MGLEIELIQFYRSKRLDELLERCAQVFERIGFPFLALKWTPAPGSPGSMMANRLSVWDNSDGRLGQSGPSLRDALAETLETGLQRFKQDTLACQNWKMQQSDVFRVSGDAPEDFLLTRSQQQLAREYIALEWQEFIAAPLCRERNRQLILVAKTHECVGDQILQAARQTMIAFINAYRCLHGRHPNDPANAGEVPDSSVLSHRELQCLQWLASGKTLGEAAIILGISERTMRFHVTNARERLGVATTIQAVVSAALTYGFDPADARRSMFATSRMPISQSQCDGA